MIFWGSGSGFGLLVVVILLKKKKIGVGSPLPKPAFFYDHFPAVYGLMDVGRPWLKIGAIWLNVYID